MDQGQPDFSERVVLVTGAGKGLGRAFAEEWASLGAHVAVNNRSRAGEARTADEVVAGIRARGGQALADYHDVRDAGAAEAMVGEAVATWGRLDAVILNAGVTGPAARFMDMDEADFREVLDINLMSNLPIVRAAIPHLKASGSGRLLFVASSAGLYGVRGRSAYAASKGALIAFALTLSHELRRDRIGVNVLSPYATTRMTADSADPRLQELLSPKRASAMAVWLSSAACSATGEIWVTGGDYVRRARMEEGVGGGPSPGAQPLEWIAANIDRLGDMEGGVGFSGAEAAFRDLAGRLTA